MFKRYRSWLLPALLLAAGGAAAEIKVGVLDIQQALLASEEAKQFMKSAETDLQGDQDELNALNGQIREMTEALQKDAEVMSPAERTRRQKEIENRQIDLRFLANKLQKAVQDRQQELMQQMGPKIQAAIEDLVDAEGYDLILQRGNVIWADASHNITAKVTEKLNEKHDAAR